MVNVQLLKISIFLISALLCLGIGCSLETGTIKETDTKAKSSIDFRPIELNSKNFAESTRDGNIWLVEFYTPWCKHCQDFANSFAHISSAFHSSPSEHIRVAKIDCSKEKALMNRFGISGFPSFFLLDGYSVYEFEKRRTEANLMDFTRGGYKQQESIPFWISPMGPMGQIQQFLIHLGIFAVDSFEGLQSRFGISPIVTGIIICAVGIVGGMISIIMLTIVTTPRAKAD